MGKGKGAAGAKTRRLGRRAGEFRGGAGLEAGKDIRRRSPKCCSVDGPKLYFGPATRVACGLLLGDDSPVFVTPRGARFVGFVIIAMIHSR